MVKEEGGCSAQWSREQEKAFENALAAHSEDCSERWEKIATAVPGKTIEDVRHHYELLVEDVNGIESGLVPLPYYPSSPEGSGHGKKEVHSHGDPSAKTSRSDQERRKGIAWTEDEHRLFLLGLDKYGKGDWRSISRNFVISRTPTQVASHAQKYFIRLKSMNKERRRTSIHDITSVGGNGDAAAPQGPITGLTSGTAAMTTNAGKPLEQSPPPRPSGGGPTGTRIMYGTAPVSHHPAPHMVHGKRSLNDSLGAAII